MTDSILARLAALDDDDHGSPPVPDPSALAAMVAAWQAVDRPTMIALLLTRLSELQQHARRRGDLAVALRCLQTMAEVARL